MFEVHGSVRMGGSLERSPTSPRSSPSFHHHINSITVAHRLNFFFHFFLIAISSRPFLYGFTLLSAPFTCLTTWSIRPYAPSTNHPRIPHLRPGLLFYYLLIPARHSEAFTITLTTSSILPIISSSTCRLSTPHSFDLTEYHTTQYEEKTVRVQRHIYWTSQRKII